MHSHTAQGLRLRRWLNLLLASALAAPPALLGQAPDAQGAKPVVPLTQTLRVIPLAGNGELNDLERQIPAPLVVQVLDRDSRPVEGAEVTVRFPVNGPSATFANQQTSQTFRTNADGQAAATGWVPNNQTGQFQVRVTASRGNEIGEATITMTNVTNSFGIVSQAQRPRRHWWSSTWFKIAVIAGAAGTAAAVILATRDSTPTVTITPGSPTITGAQ